MGDCAGPMMEEAAPPVTKAGETSFGGICSEHRNPLSPLFSPDDRAKVHADHGLFRRLNKYNQVQPKRTGLSLAPWSPRLVLQLKEHESKSSTCPSHSLATPARPRLLEYPRHDAHWIQLQIESESLQIVPGLLHGRSCANHDCVCPATKIAVDVYEAIGDPAPLNEAPCSSLER
ncbi:hypothetical protein BDZ85DRAFT_46171 [Elsinoe ampelina]|uniref:Uncharacterized protein n=1 Tax=Elsinoe ampelina TaxID=302913 RepID=A0A6A6G0K6_9PEZI|nr:hypothetical protein BDZ85DRAFT_46171 [Elsinoe ampelina]